MYYGLDIYDNAKPFELRVISILEDRYRHFAFHNVGHTLVVLERVRKLGRMFRYYRLMTPRHIFRAEVEALTHDLVQDFEWQPMPNGIGFRRHRFTGHNETRSSEEAAQLLRECATDFNQQEQQWLRVGHQATVPAFDLELKTVYQKYLDPSAPYWDLCLALADLGSAGIDPEHFLFEGDALIREERLFVLSQLSVRQRELLREELVLWSDAQSAFARGRKAKTDQETAHLPDGIQEEVRAYLSHFDESIALAEERAEKRRRLSLETLLKDMGFVLC